MFKNLCFSKSVSGVVQMSENSVLFFENIFGLRPGFAVVWVSVHRVRSTKVPNLSNTQFSITGLLIKKPWLHIARVDVIGPRDDIMVHTRSVIQRLWYPQVLAENAPLRWGQLAPLALGHLTPLAIGNLASLGSCFHSLKPVQLLSVVINYPRCGTLVILSISGLGHHKVVYFLLGTSGRGRIVTYVIGFVYWHFFCNDIISIEFSIWSKFSSLINKCLGSHRNSALHETEILLNTHGWFFISSDINVFDSVLL